MLNALSTIASETFTLLRRDRVFLPALVCGLAVTGFANLASDWSIEDFEKILYDVGFFGFQFTGGAVALLWGTKAVNDSKLEGSLEVQLAAPVPRPVWLFAKYLGIALCLLLLASLLLAFWQAFMLLNEFGLMTKPELLGFALMVLGWLVLAALAVFVATLAGQAVALFAGACLWLAGLVSADIAATVSPDSPAYVRSLTGWIARIWDLRQLGGYVPDLAAGPAATQEIIWRAGYGVALILTLLTLAALAFQRRDLV